MKKNGFIAISLIYSFFLCFIILMMGLLINYTHSRLILDKINEPLEYEPFPLLTNEIMKNKTTKTESCNINFLQGEPPYNNSVTECGSGLFKEKDDDGDSYYFRGKVENNYVIFDQDNKMDSIVWRIVRINGDKTIRLIAEDNIGAMAYNTNMTNPKFVGYTYDNNHICTKENPCTKSSGTSSPIKEYLETWYNNNLKQYDDKIVEAKYCNDTTKKQRVLNGVIINKVYDFGFDFRHGYLTGEAPSPLLSCPDTSETYGGLYELKIGLITADEALFAGLSYDWGKRATDNYLVNINKDNYWTLSPGGYNIGAESIYGEVVSSFYVMSDNIGTLAIDNIGRTEGGKKVELELLKVRPVINLKADTIVSGAGTENNPYVIK